MVSNFPEFEHGRSSDLHRRPMNPAYQTLHQISWRLFGQKFTLPKLIWNDTGNECDCFNWR